MEIEYITEEPEIYDPNYIFFKRIFEAFKVAAPHFCLSALAHTVFYLLSGVFIAVTKPPCPSAS